MYAVPRAVHYRSRALALGSTVAAGPLCRREKSRSEARPKTTGLSGSSTATSEASPDTFDQDMEQRIKAYRELYDARKVETLKQLEEARRRYEARERAYAEKVENFLRQREERLADIAKQYDERRQKIVSERDYLVDHHQELLQMAIDRKDAMIKRQEEMRNEAQERKKRLAAFISAMEDMTPQERHNYINSHYKEMFDQAEEAPGAYPGGPPPGPMSGPLYGENPYSRTPAAPQ